MNMQSKIIAPLLTSLLANFFELFFSTTLVSFFAIKTPPIIIRIPLSAFLVNHIYQISTYYIVVNI